MKSVHATSRDEVHYVYLIADGEYVKIGYSGVAASVRLSALQVGNPRPLNLYMVAEFPAYKQARTAETRLYLALKPYFVRGEWFKIPVQQAAQCLRTIMAQQESQQ